MVLNNTCRDDCLDYDILQTFLVHPGQTRGSTYNYNTTASFHIIYRLTFIYETAIFLKSFLRTFVVRVPFTQLFNLYTSVK